MNDRHAYASMVFAIPRYGSIHFVALQALLVLEGLELKVSQLVYLVLLLHVVLNTKFNINAALLIILIKFMYLDNKLTNVFD